MKTVVSNSQVAHLWANQSQEHARNGRNFYFQGDTIYSYGSHFPIARIVEREGKGKAVLFTIRTYSKTTAKHCSIVRPACSHYEKIFHVKDPTSSNFLEFFEEYFQRASNLWEKAKRARSNAVYFYNQYDDVINEANNLADYFDLDVPRLVRHKDFLGLRGEAEEKRVEQNKKQDEARQKRYEEGKRIVSLTFKEKLEEWLQGKSNYFQSNYFHNDYYYGVLSQVYLRVKNNILQTTKGAEVPEEHAKKAALLVKKCRENKTEYVKNGHSVRIGMFTIDNIDTEGNVTAGCHFIEWSEIERIAKLQRWFEEEK